ncbi:MAG: methyltransferase domain-containing protein [Actinomycetota bacterium]
MTSERLRTYFTEDLGWGWSHQAKAVFALLTHAARDCTGGAILDAGAGRQRYRPFFEEHSLYLAMEHPQGIAHKGMVDLTYDLLGELDERIPLEEDCLHGVINTSVLEHVRRPERFIAEAHRVLRPGGRLYTNVPFTYPEHEEPYDYQRPTSYALRSWLADAGFVDVEVVPTSSNLSAAVAFVEEALRWDLAAVGRPDEHHRLTALAAPVLEELRRVGDGLVHAETRFPIGWVAIGRKVGTLEPAGTLDRAAFLDRHRSLSRTDSGRRHETWTPPSTSPMPTAPPST